MRWEWVTTSTKSGLSNEGAVRLNGGQPRCSSSVWSHLSTRRRSPGGFHLDDDAVVVGEPDNVGLVG